jgi:hypothetical protein
VLGNGPEERRRGRRGHRKKLRSREGLTDRFLYRLAAHLKIPNVEEWKDEVTIDQVHRWMAYYRVEPFGEDWLRTARGTLFTAMAFGAKPDDTFIDMFLPSYDPDRELTEDEINAKIAAYAARQGR